MLIASKLLSWYEKNKRPFPWRNTQDPYKIWVSEIILQQTRVQQGLNYYLRFIEKFPTVKHLADASEDAVLLLWQGLGYYSRARNMHFSARLIVNELNGIFPNNFKDLKLLKGVGNYTAAAVASFAFGEEIIALDGNAYRVFARILGLKKEINTPQAEKEFTRCALLIKENQPAQIFNQAIMELGATCCTPTSPKCERCPVVEHCYARSKNMVNKLPVKKQKIKIKNRYFHYVLFLLGNNSILIEKRTTNDIWKSLFQLPLYEGTTNNSDEFLKWKKLKENKIKNTDIQQYNIEPILHKLTHRNIYCYFWIVKTQKTHKNRDEYKEIAIPELKNYAFPIVIRQFLDAYLFS